MPELDINDLALKGIVRDEPAYMQPPEIWTVALNMRSKNNGMELMEGWSEIFATPPVAPHFAMPVVGPVNAFWLYVSLTKGYTYDGSTHTDLTRTSGGDYAAANTRDWNGTILGGLPILNNGLDVPQYWAAPTIVTKLANVTNWTSGMKAKVIRAFGAYLMAFNITKGTDIFPHLVKWSSETQDPGALPDTWDETDFTKDSGEYDLYDVNSGVIFDAMTLAGKMFIYKEQSTWVSRFVGGRAVFSFDTLYETSGILAPRCVVVTGDGKNQIVATQDDLIIHNGGDPASILEKKLRREIFARIDSTNYINSFLYVDPENREVVFAFPETGMTNPNRGVVFNYKTGAVTEMDGITFRNAATGRIETISEELWSDGTDSWDDDTGSWNQQERRRTLLCGTNATKFYKLNSGSTRDGTQFTGTLQRTSLALVGRKRTGEWIEDHEVKKMLDRLWPKIKGSAINIRVGAQDTVDGAVTWGPYRTFDPNNEVFWDADPPVEGRAVCVEFQGLFDFRLDGYKINITPLGHF